MATTLETEAHTLDGTQLETAVKGYLKSHPELLQDDPALLAQILDVEPQDDGKVIDFQARLIDRFKDKTAALALQAEKAERDAQETREEVDTIHEAILALLDARTFEALIDAITAGLPRLLSVKSVSIGLEGEFDAEAKALTERLSVQQLTAGDVDRMVGPGEDVHFFTSHEPGSRDASNDEDDVLTQGALAVLRLDLGPHSPKALLALSSDKPGRFQAGDAVAPHYGFLAKVIAKLIRHWLRLPLE